MCLCGTPHQALEQYESITHEAAKFAKVEADLRSQNAALSAKVQDQSIRIREQRNAIAQAEQTSANANSHTVEMLKGELRNECQKGKDKDLRIAKLEKVKLSTEQVRGVFRFSLVRF